jgi:predicted adenine nucleotide alpha hydrolase (AANH) superfamily ATPase
MSLNIRKHNNITEIQNNIKEIANDSGCNFFYDNYEFENNKQMKRTNYMFTTYFEKEPIVNLLYFIKNIKKIPGIYIETIYDADVNVLLYASKYYQRYMMNALLAKKYNITKRERSYSEDETKILRELGKDVLITYKNK